MTDRELLELAAKAAGFESSFTDVDSLMWVSANGEDWKPWNPLADDGDALRLAVKLQMDVYHLADAEVYASYPSGIERLAYMIERYGSDPYAATRRAIVRAAAEIGDTK